MEHYKTGNINIGMSGGTITTTAEDTVENRAGRGGDININLT